MRSDTSHRRAARRTSGSGAGCSCGYFASRCVAVGSMGPDFGEASECPHAAHRTGLYRRTMNLRRLRARSGLPVVAAVVVIGGLVTACGAAASLATPASTSPSSSVTQTGGRDFLLTAQEVESLQGEKSRFATVIQRCDRQLSEQPRPVATLALVQHYTTSGTDPGSVTSNTLAPDAQMAYADGLCYLVTGDTKYAAHAQSIIDAWAKTLGSVPTLQGKDAVNFDMPYMIGAASWVRAVNGWNDAPFTSFLHTVVLPNAETSNPNNHGMWAVLMVAAAATFTADSSLLMSAENRWAQILQGEVTADGSMPQEAERSDTSDTGVARTRASRESATRITRCCRRA